MTLSLMWTLTNSVETYLIPEEVYWSITIHQHAVSDRSDCSDRPFGCKVWPLSVCILSPRFRYDNISNRKVNRRARANFEKVKVRSRHHTHTISQRNKQLNRNGRLKGWISKWFEEHWNIISSIGELLGIVCSIQALCQVKCNKAACHHSCDLNVWRPHA